MNIDAARTTSKEQYRFFCVALRGDWKFLKETLNLNRHWASHEDPFAETSETILVATLHVWMCACDIYPLMATRARALSLSLYVPLFFSFPRCLFLQTDVSFEVAV